MTARPDPMALVLHAVRILGFAAPSRIADRVGLDLASAAEALGDAEAYGWATHAAFAGLEGWSLTDAGRAEGERRLAVELAASGGEAEIRAVHREFLPLNARLQAAVTDWQLRPAEGDPLAGNDHADAAWDARVLDELDRIGRELGPLVARLRRVLDRFAGYDARFDAARARARAGDGSWVDRTDRDSCHRVWFELHEDLLATLGLARGREA